mmetsp:Transcript_119185/g.362602  ORF Transcript_119185/g.362602 Transcript_119185/m.362602 type:complete len:263 (-) Transcript_119185:474-1262(-)
MRLHGYSTAHCTKWTGHRPPHACPVAIAAKATAAAAFRAQAGTAASRCAALLVIPWTPVLPPSWVVVALPVEFSHSGESAAKRVTASFASPRSIGLSSAISLRAASVAFPPSTIGCKTALKSTHSSPTTSICCRMQECSACTSCRSESPSSKPMCEVSKSAIVLLSACRLASGSTPKAIKSTSLDMRWLSMRCRPAMFTVAPGTVAPASVAALTYRVTAAFDWTSNGTLCAATSERTPLGIGEASTLPSSSALKVAQRPFTT